jgi:hypothetical protein
MYDFIIFLIVWWKSFDRGDLENFPDPAAPVDLGSPLTQPEIDQLKTILNIINNKFPVPDDPGT